MSHVLPRAQRLLALVLAISVITACATEEEPRETVDAREGSEGSWMLVSPTPDPGASVGYPDAVFEGAVLLDPSTGCVAGQLGEELVGLIFPAVASLGREGVQLSPGGAFIEFDSEQTLGGGFQTRAELESRGGTFEPCDYAEYFTINPDR